MTSPTVLTGTPPTKTLGDPGPIIGAPAVETPMTATGRPSTVTLGSPVAVCPQVAGEPKTVGNLKVILSPC